MDYRHKVMAALDLKRYEAGVRLTDLASATGINRVKLGILLTGPTHDEVSRIAAALEDAK